MQQERLWTAEFLSMGGTNFLLYMSQYIMIASLPLYIMQTLGGGELEAGLAMTFFQIGTICCRPIAGRVIDAVHKQRLLAVMTGVFLAVMLAFNFWNTLTGVYALRLVHGAMFACATTAAAAMAAMVLPVTRKGEGIGYFALSTNLSMVVGPLIGLLIIGLAGADMLFIFMVGLALVTVGAANYRRLPDEIVLPAKRRPHAMRITDFIERRALAAAGLAGLVFFAYGGVLTFIPLYAGTLGLQSETSAFFAVFAAVIVLSRPFIGRIFDSKGPDYTVYPGFLLFAIGMILFGQITTVTGLLIAAALLGLGFGALGPAFQTLAVKSAPMRRSGVATATYFWALDISVGLAAVLLSLVAAEWGYPFMYSYLSTAVIVAGALLYLLWRRTPAAQKLLSRPSGKK